jgi:vacuolar-type H+-ATPase subunit I/STV1
MRLPQHSFLSTVSQKRAKLIIATAIIITIVPSVYLAFQLVRHEVFKTEVNHYLESVTRTEKNLFILEKKIDPVSQEINLTIAGKALDKNTMERLNAQLKEYQLNSAKLIVHTFEQNNDVNLSMVKTEIQQDLYRNSVHLLEAKNAKIQQLEATIQSEISKQQKQTEQMGEYDQVRAELQAQYPELQTVMITHGRSQAATVQDNTTQTIMPADDTLIVYLEARRPVSKTTQTRIRNWLKTRFKLENVYVVSKTT